MQRRTQRSFSGSAPSRSHFGPSIRLRSGSTGHTRIPDEEDEHQEQPIHFMTKGLAPADIRIIEPDDEEGSNGHYALVDDVLYEGEDDDRGGWGNKLDFLFSCISVSVGLGNVWRFPYLCYKNGGGTFLLIYFIAMFACGIPIFFQEVAAGQYLGSGGMTMIGQFVPMLQGVGYATMTIVFFLDIYYCVIIAWTLFYLGVTILSIPDLPWGSCGNWWNTNKCFDAEHASPNSSALLDNTTKTPVEEYWDQRVLQITDGIDDLGGIQPELLLTLMVAWIIVYFIIWKGLHSSGKIIWFTALFPYFVMTILFFRAVTLPGASVGLWRYVTPDWSKLRESETWIDSATQIFFAYSIGTGALPALGSYNKFHHNCIKDAIITCIVNTGTCLFAGVVTFSILGHMAYNQNVGIDEVVNSGPGLVFITYPEVVLKLPGGSIWAIIFFVMLVTIGIDSEFCIVESLVTGIVDMWPGYLRPRRRLFTSSICVLLFALGVPMTTRGGAYIFQLIDFYGASGIPILWCCFFQTIAIGWIFGFRRFAACVEQMTGYKPSFYWLVTWAIIAPLVMALIFLFYVFQWEPVKYGHTAYPTWAHGFGFFMSFCSMLWIPGYAIYYVITQPGSLMEVIQRGITPDIKNDRSRMAAKVARQELPMSESSARLLKNVSFLTNNTSSFNVENP